MHKRRIFVRYWSVEMIALSMLRLLLSNAPGCRNVRSPSKPCHVGIHWKALTDYSQMITHLPGFQSFSSFFA